MEQLPIFPSLKTIRSQLLEQIPEEDSSADCLKWAESSRVLTPERVNFITKLMENTDNAEIINQTYSQLYRKARPIQIASIKQEDIDLTKTQEELKNDLIRKIRLNSIMGFTSIEMNSPDQFMSELKDLYKILSTE